MPREPLNRDRERGAGDDSKSISSSPGAATAVGDGGETEPEVPAIELDARCRISLACLLFGGGGVVDMMGMTRAAGDR